MRVRILTSPPLPPLKAWFTDNSLEPSATILTLKAALCTGIHALRSAHINARDISLTLNDFELLNESSIDVVRDGELLCIESAPTKMHFRQQKTSLDISPSAEESKSSTSPISISESCSFSSKSTSSDTDSSSNSSLSETIKLAQNRVFVAPGQGKAATRRRNLRRRLKKKHPNRSNLLDNGSTISQPTASRLTLRTSNSTCIPPSYQNSECAMDVMVLRRMTKPIINKYSKDSQKIIFATENDSRAVSPHYVTATASASSSQIAIQGSNSSAQSSLIVPSLRQMRGELPCNMFVTSVDVEKEVLTDKRRKNCVPTGNQTHIITANMEADSHGVAVGNEYLVDETCKLKFGAGSQPMSLNIHEWVESKWDQLSKITEASQLQPGMVIGWKALGIDFSSLTPGVLLNIACICKIQDGEVTVSPLPLPKSAVTFETGLDVEDDKVVSINVLLSDSRHLLI